MAVSDSSPLIWLSKMGKVWLLRDLFEEVLVPEEVYREVVEVGLAEGYSDALVLKDCIEEGWLKSCSLDEQDKGLLRRITRNAQEIHRGEAAAILIAKRKELPLLIDETSGRALAESFGLKPHGTLYIVLRAMRKGLIGKKEAKDSILRMVETGMRIDPALLSRIIKEIEKFPV